MTHAVATRSESKNASGEGKHGDARPPSAGPRAGMPVFMQRASRGRTAGPSASHGDDAAVQTKCACGGTCASCAEREETLQKKDSSGGNSGASTGSRRVHSVARGGIATAEQPLPHFDRIQASFGSHDVSGIRTQTGGPAADANERMGSVGYTVGERIGFRSDPDVKLAAHEATHVLHQRSGVQLDDGVGHPGDPYEQHADAVAETVARGETAEGLLAHGPRGADASSDPRSSADAPVQHQLSVNATRMFEAGPVASEVPAESGAADESEEEGGGEGEAAAEEGAEEVSAEDADAAAEAGAEEEAAPAEEGGGGGGGAAGGGSATATAGEGAACSGGTEPQCYRGESPEPDPEPEETPPNPPAGEVEQETSDEGEEDLPEPDNCRSPADLAAQAGSSGAEPVAAAEATPAAAPAADAAIAATSPTAAAVSGGGGGGGGGGAAPAAASAGSPIEGAITEAETGRGAAVAAYAGSSAALSASAANTAALRGGVQFGATSAEDAQQRADATARANVFFAQAADQLDVAIDYALNQAPDQLGAQAEAAKSEIASSIEIQKAAISERIDLARGQARGSAAMARREVMAQAASFVSDVEAGTAAAIEALTGTHADTMGQVNDLETATLDSINQMYADGRADLEGLGPLVGDECITTGNRFAAAYRKFREPNCTENGFWDGDLAERRSMAQEKAAHKTAEGYRDRMVESARKRAREVAKAGRKKDRCAVIGAGASARDTLDQQLDALITTLGTTRDSTIEQAGQARDAIIRSIDGSLASTLRQLDRQEYDQRQTANDTGYMQQVLQEQVAHAGAASLQQSVAEAADTVEATLAQLRTQFATGAPPDLGALDAALSGVTQRLNAALGGLQTTVAGGTALAAEQLTAVAQQGLAALEGVTQSNSEMADAVSDGFAASMSQIAGTDNFAAQRDGFAQVVQQSTDAGSAALAQAFDAMSEGCDVTMTQAEETIDQAYIDLEANLRQSQQGLECDITTKATQAASEEAPAWKLLVAILLVIIVIVIVIAVTVVTAGGALAALGPIATIAAGAAIGAAVGAVTSGLLAIASNLWNNRSWTEGVGQAMLVGAITGAIGGGIGAAAGVGVGVLFQGASKAAQVGAQLVTALVTAGGLDVVTQYVMGGFSFEHFSWTNLGMTLVITVLTFGLGHRAAAARAKPPTPPPPSRRMGTVTAGPEGIVEHAPSSPVVERAPAGRRSPVAEPEASARPTEPIDTPEPSPRRGSTSEEINEVIAEETRTTAEMDQAEATAKADSISEAPPERAPAETPEGPEPTPPAAETADPKAARNKAELEAELGRRDLLDDPTFQGMDAQTEGKVNTALKGDPIAKASEQTQLRTQEWARRAAGGDPREFANRYEYARARFNEARAAAAVRLKGQPNSKARAVTEAEAEITPARLDERLAADIEASRDLGPGQRLQDIGVDVGPEATPRQVADAVQKLDRVGFESETAEAYHAVKHREELPPSMRSDNPVRDYAAAATDTIRTGRVVVAAPSGESTLVVIHQTYGAPPNVRVLEAIVYVGRDGSVTLASYGAPKFKL